MTPCLEAGNRYIFQARASFVGYPVTVTTRMTSYSSLDSGIPILKPFILPLFSGSFSPPRNVDTNIFPFPNKTQRPTRQELADARKATEEAIAREAATADAVREAEAGVDRNAGGSGPKCWVGLP